MSRITIEEETQIILIITNIILIDFTLTVFFLFVQNPPSPDAVFSKASISIGTFVINLLNLIDDLTFIY